MLKSLTNQLKLALRDTVFVFKHRKVRNGGNWVCSYFYAAPGTEKLLMLNINWEVAKSCGYRRDKTGAIYGDPYMLFETIKHKTGLTNLKLEVC